MSDDTLQHFLQRAADHRLLTAHEEKRLGRIVQAGGEHGKRARDELVTCNIRLVVSVARYYRNRGLPLEDVVQYGIIGLNRAAEKFDPEKNIRFSTYATLWIKQAIQRGIASSGTAIRLPSAVAASRAKVRAALTRHPDADPEFLADLLEIDVSEVERALDAAEVVTSLDRETTTDDHTHSMLDAMPSADDWGNAHDPFEDVGGDESAALQAALPKLPKDHRRVLELHFGLTGKPPMTCEEIGKRMSISTNKVKYIRAEGIEFLQHRLGSPDAPTC